MHTVNREEVPRIVEHKDLQHSVMDLLKTALLSSYHGNYCYFQLSFTSLNMADID